MNLPSPISILLPISYMAGLFLLSSIPGDIPPDNIIGKTFLWVSPAWQNLLHIPLYGGLAASWLWSLTAFQIGHVHRLAATFLLSMLWALVDETHQMSVPGRYHSLTDLLLNLLGVSCVITHSHFFRQKT